MIDLKKSFFPKSFKIEQVHEKDGGYVFDLMSTSENSFCPQCNEKSSRTHSYQERRARDLPILGKTVTLQIKQKRYFCDNRECEVDIFTDTISD